MPLFWCLCAALPHRSSAECSQGQTDRPKLVLKFACKRLCRCLLFSRHSAGRINISEAFPKEAQKSAFRSRSKAANRTENVSKVNGTSGVHPALQYQPESRLNPKLVEILKAERCVLVIHVSLEREKPMCQMLCE